MYLSLTYFSRATHLPEEAELTELLKTARCSNHLLHVTGMLIYVQGTFFQNTEGRFMQVLEGSEKNVRAIFEKITQDRRHTQISVINERAIGKRNFAGWSMGFRSLQAQLLPKELGFFELNDTFLLSGKSGKFNSSLNFLKSFYSISKK